MKLRLCNFWQRFATSLPNQQLVHNLKQVFCFSSALIEIGHVISGLRPAEEAKVSKSFVLTPPKKKVKSLGTLSTFAQCVINLGSLAQSYQC